MRATQSKTLILSRPEVQEIVQKHGLDEVMDDLINRLEKTFQNFDNDKLEIPARSGFHYEQPKTGLIEWMPIYKKGEQVVIKVVGYHPENPDTTGLPTIISTISAYDTSSGHLIGLTDGVLLTALRTGAISAVASKYMALPESKILGLIGCGAQAVTQLHAISRVFDLDKVMLYDIDEKAISSFAQRCAVLELDIEITSASMEEIVAASDIICTSTSIDVGAGPLFENLETKPHLHINAVGSDFPGKTELPIGLLKNSFVCPDFLAQAIVEGECQQLSSEDIGPEIVQVLQNPSQYTEVKKQRSVFDSTGWALQDQVVMELFLEYGKSMGIGQEVEIEAMPADAKNPYDFMDNLTLKMPLRELSFALKNGFSDDKE